MSKFKAGDLALLIGGNNPALIGQTVTLQFYVEPFALMDMTTVYRAGIFQNDSEPAWNVLFSCGGKGFFDERHLMPLRGDDQSTETTHRQPLETCT